MHTIKATITLERGYRGAPSNFVYLPPGQYAIEEISGAECDVAKRVITPALAKYLQSIDWPCDIVDVELQPEPTAADAPAKPRAKRKTTRRSPSSKTNTES